MFVASGDLASENTAAEEAVKPIEEPGEEIRTKVQQHPLNRIISLAANFSRYVLEFQKRVHDKSLLVKLVEASETSQSILRDIPVERLQLFIEPFKGYQKEYGLELELHFQYLHEEMVTLGNTLSGNPERIFILRDYANVFQDLDRKIQQSKSQYEKNLPHRISTEKMYSVLQDGKNSAAYDDSARLELEELWGFLFALSTFTMFRDLNKVRLGEISSEIHALQQCLEQGRQLLDEEVLKKTEYHAHRLEAFLEMSYSYHYKLYKAIFKSLETSQKFKTVRFSTLEDIENNLDYLQSEILPICEKFSAPQRTGLSELRRYFDRFKRSYKGPSGEAKISVGLSESLQVYLESRLLDSRLLVNSELPEQIIKTIQVIFQDEVFENIPSTS